LLIPLSLRPVSPSPQTSQHARSIGLWEKNIFIYVYGMAANLLFLALVKPDYLRPAVFATIFDSPIIFPIVFCSVFGGAGLPLVGPVPS